MAKFGFIGPTYTSRSKTADGERCINRFLEAVEEPGHGKSPVFMPLRPGLRLRVPLPDAPVRGIYSGDDLTVFAVAGSTMFQITSRAVSPNPLGSGLRLAIILHLGDNPEAFPLPTHTATQFGTAYAAVTGLPAPAPATYGFQNSGDGKWYAAAATVTIDQWLTAFLSPNSYVTLGKVPFGTTPARIFSNKNSLFVVSANQGTLFNPSPGQQVTAAIMGGYVNGYLLALQPGGVQVNFSGIFDGASWAGLDFFATSASPDAILSILVDHTEVWLFKQQTTQVYDNTSDPNFVFQENPSGNIEQGIVAPWSAVKLDNTVFWLGGDERGAGVVWRAQGYTPSRVSNHAMEAAIQAYPQINDAEAFAFQMGGHSFYVIHFPSANKGTGATWVYDCAASAQLGAPQWYEWLYWNTANGQWSMFRARCHAYANMVHYAGDWTNGNIYALDPECTTDDGNPLRWLRSSPHIANSLEPVFHSNLRLDMQVGIGLNDNVGMGPDIAGPHPGAPLGVAGEAPVVVMRMSNDGGQTWGNDHPKSCGAQGQYRVRARWPYALGSAFDRCYEISGSDPVPTALIEADVDTEPGA